MRCHICDKVLESPNYSTDHDCYDPCEACLVVVNETLKGYEDVVSADEDTFSQSYGLGDASDIVYALYGDPDLDGEET